VLHRVPSAQDVRECHFMGNCRFECMIHLCVQKLIQSFSISLTLEHSSALEQWKLHLRFSNGDPIHLHVSSVLLSFKCAGDAALKLGWVLKATVLIPYLCIPTYRIPARDLSPLLPKLVNSRRMCKKISCMQRGAGPSHCFLMLCVLIVDVLSVLNL